MIRTSGFTTERYASGFLSQITFGRRFSPREVTTIIDMQRWRGLAGSRPIWQLNLNLLPSCNRRSRCHSRHRTPITASIPPRLLHHPPRGCRAVIPTHVRITAHTPPTRLCPPPLVIAPTTWPTPRRVFSQVMFISCRQHPSGSLPRVGARPPSCCAILPSDFFFVAYRARPVLMPRLASRTRVIDSSPRTSATPFLSRLHLQCLPSHHRRSPSLTSPRRPCTPSISLTSPWPISRIVLLSIHHDLHTPHSECTVKLTQSSIRPSPHRSSDSHPLTVARRAPTEHHSVLKHTIYVFTCVTNHALLGGLWGLSVGTHFPPWAV